MHLVFSLGCAVDDGEHSTRAQVADTMIKAHIYSWIAVFTWARTRIVLLPLVRSDRSMASNDEALERDNVP